GNCSVAMACSNPSAATNLSATSQVSLASATGSPNARAPLLQRASVSASFLPKAFSSPASKAVAKVSPHAPSPANGDSNWPAWMQDRESGGFLAATSNNITTLPPEMLRKGRFDEIFFVDLPSPSVRINLFALHLKKRSRDPQTFDLAKLSVVSEGFSGAEIE